MTLTLGSFFLSRHSFTFKTNSLKIMIRRASSSPSPSSSPVQPPSKRLKLAPPLNYKNGVVLAPMVRSSTLPSRLLALRYGADLVWGPETVDKAIIGCERAVDPKTGVISYHREGRPIFTCHPVEKPYLIYQVGSANPELAAQAASKVAEDVSGIDLNCGCPKPFSTSGGMGAALLSTPDLLCDILKAIRAAVPPQVSVSVKIRLLPTEEETLALVRKIVETKAVRALTVHCRTRNMRMKEAAMVEKLVPIVNLCRELDPGLAVLQNGDCVDRAAAMAVRKLTGCDSVMIATAAESNLSCFLDGPVVDAATELIPKYTRLAHYIDNSWGNSKHSLSQFKSPPSVAPPGAKKSAKKEFRATLASAKTYADLSEFIGGIEGGEEVLKEVEQVLAAREQAMDASRLLEVVQPDVEGTAPVREEAPSLSATMPPAPALQFEPGVASLVSV